MRDCHFGECKNSPLEAGQAKNQSFHGHYGAILCLLSKDEWDFPILHITKIRIVDSAAALPNGDVGQIIKIFLSFSIY